MRKPVFPGVGAALLLAAVVLLSCAPGGGESAQQARAETDRPGFEPEVDTVGVYITRTTAFLDSLEGEAKRLAGLIPPARLEGEGEGPEYFVMFYYWLFEARDLVEQMQGLLVGFQFERLLPEVEDRAAKAAAELTQARERITRDRSGQ